MTNTVPNIFDKLTNVNNQLQGAPSGVLLFLGIIVIARALISWHKFSNDAIPIIILFVGIGGWLLCAPPSEAGYVRQWWGRNLLIGIIISGASWFAHRNILKRIEKKLSLGNGFDTELKTKEQTGDK